MKRLIIRFHGSVALGFLVVTASLSACVVPQAVGVKAAPRILVWPIPPARPRVTYRREIRFPEAIRHRGSGWQRLARWVTGGGPPVELVRPYGVAVSADGRLWIADPGAHRVHVFDLADGDYRSLPLDRDHLRLLSPIGVALAGDGRAFVSDSAAGVVYRFGPKGKLLGRVEGFQRPTGVAWSVSLGRLYVVDTQAHQVGVYTGEGHHLFDFGHRGRGEGELYFPTQICLGRDGQVYVVDAMNFRVQIFDMEGHWHGTFGTLGDRPGMFSKPRGIATDRDGHIYVADGAFDNLQIFDSSGVILLYVGQVGTAPGQFSMPAGIAVDGDDRIYVADSFNRRIQVFQYLRPEVEGDGVGVPGGTAGGGPVTSKGREKGKRR